MPETSCLSQDVAACHKKVMNLKRMTYYSFSLLLQARYPDTSTLM